MESIEVRTVLYKFTDYNIDKESELAKKALSNYRNWLIKDDWWTGDIHSILLDRLKFAGVDAKDIYFNCFSDCWIMGAFIGDIDMDKLTDNLESDPLLFELGLRLHELKTTYPTLQIMTTNYKDRKIIVDTDEGLSTLEQNRLKLKVNYLVSVFNRWACIMYTNEHERLTSDEVIIKDWIDKEIIFNINGTMY